MRIFLQGIKLPGTRARRKKLPIHLESLVPSLLPLTAFTHFGLAMVTLIWSSRRLKTGIRYLPVDFIQTSKQELSRSHCLKRRISLLKVEKYLWVAAKQLGIHSIALIDSWVNYGIRFSQYPLWKL